MPKAVILLATPPLAYHRYRSALVEAFPQLEIEMVGRHADADGVMETADCLLTFGAQMADHVLRNARRLKWIQSLGVGVDGLIDLPSLRPDVIVTNVRGLHEAPVSEAVIAAMLALSRDLPRLVRAQDARLWDRPTPSLIGGKTIGILGVGAIAQGLASRARALGMKTIGITQTVRDVAGFDEIVSRSELLGIAGRIDFFVVLVSLTSETRGIVDGATLSAMKPTSFLINVARGGVVDESALLEALENGTIRGAALDVFNSEPLPSDHPFWSMENVMITPHVAGSTEDYPERSLPQILENMRCFLQGDTSKMVNVCERS